MQRNSSIELFRILVTLFVLIVHLNGYYIGLDTHKFNFHSFQQIAVESLSCIAVNGFILISGYFGIKLSFHALYKLWQSLITIYVPLFILKIIFDFHDLQWSDLLKAFFPFSTRDGYFINGYIFLLLVSPFINVYISSRTKRGVVITTVGFVLFEFWVDCICGLKTFYFSEGYSGLHFCIMYLIGRCLNMYSKSLKRIGFGYYLGMYFLMSAIIILLSVLKVPWTWYYSNIFMIISAVSLFMVFANQEPFHNKYINSIAASSLFVYILQIVSPFQGWLTRVDRFLYDNMSWILYFISIVLISLIFYIFSFIWDYIRRRVMGKMFDSIESDLNKFLIKVKIQ